MVFLFFTEESIIGNGKDNTNPEIVLNGSSWHQFMALLLSLFFSVRHIVAFDSMRCITVLSR